MKRTIFYFLVCIISLNFSCSSSSQQTKSTGILSGEDVARCACCGGYKLTIDNDDKEYRIEELPSDSEILLDEMEKSIIFTWTLDRVCSGIHYLNIESIELN